MRILKKFYAAFLFAAGAMIISHPAIAATFEVQMQQVNPQGEVFTAICNEESASCFHTITISPLADRNAKDQQYIDVGIRFVPGAVYFQFMWQRQYLDITGTDKDYIEVPMAASGFEKQRIELHLPNPLADQDRQRSAIPLVIRKPGTLLARLEISVKPPER